jgi:hypothetical protein
VAGSHHPYGCLLCNPLASQPPGFQLFSFARIIIIHPFRATRLCNELEQHEASANDGGPSCGATARSGRLSQFQPTEVHIFGSSIATRLGNGHYCLNVRITCNYLSTACPPAHKANDCTHDMVIKRTALGLRSQLLQYRGR